MAYTYELQDVWMFHNKHRIIRDRFAVAEKAYDEDLINLTNEILERVGLEYGKYVKAVISSEPDEVITGMVMSAIVTMNGRIVITIREVDGDFKRVMLDDNAKINII